MKHSNRPWHACVIVPIAYLVTLCLTDISVVGAEPSTIILTAPKPNQVVQRVGFDPAAARQKPREAPFGFANVVVYGSMPNETEHATWEDRIIAAKETMGSGTPWTKLSLRLMEATAVEPIGVGEVFVVVGQTYRPELHFARISTNWLTDADSSEPFVANSLPR